MSAQDIVVGILTIALVVGGIYVNFILPKVNKNKDNKK